MFLPYVLAHFIGDFLLQNDYIAVNKKKSSLVCTFHVILYMLPFCFTGINEIQFFLIFIQHWLQDRTVFVAFYCRTFGIFQSELKQNALVANNKFERVLPWGHFIIDQIFHFIWLWVVYNYFG